MKVEDIKKAACVGGGVIGSSWTLLFAMKGIDVCLYDINDEQIENCKKNIERNIDSLVEFGALKKKISGRFMEESVIRQRFPKLWLMRALYRKTGLSV